MAPRACNVGLPMIALKDDEPGTTTHKGFAVLDLGFSPTVIGTELMPEAE